MSDSLESKSEVLKHWQNMFDDLKEWFKTADNRARKAHAMFNSNSLQRRTAIYKLPMPMPSGWTSHVCWRNQSG
jgi:hypothetical protein